MTVVDWLLDGALACALPGLAWRASRTDDLHEAVVLFIAFGLFSALAWARLGAPDVALVEAAVGAGLTGALLMSAIRWIGPARSQPAGVSGARRALPALVVLVLVAGLAAVAGPWPAAVRSASGLRDAVAAGLPDAGVDHPVTAVLLAFRGHDTLLEVLVLLVAAITVRAHVSELPAEAAREAAEPLVALVRLVLPGLVLVAGYVVWRGSTAPGGAFQAGAILAGGGILLMLAGRVRPPPRSARWVRLALAAGPALFLVAAAAPLSWGARVLEYPAAWAGRVILGVELALTVSIGLGLALFFPAPPRAERGGGAHRSPARAGGGPRR